MIVISGKVLAVEPGYAIVAAQVQSPCGHCDPQTGCRALSIARMFQRQQPSLRLKHTLPLSPGDWVMLSIQARSVMWGAIWVYLLPILGLLSGAFLASPAGELASVLGALGGFTLLLWLGTALGRIWQGPFFTSPVIAGKLEPHSSSYMEHTCRSKN